MHVQQDAGGYCYISPFMVEKHPTYIIIGENEAFCVKLGLNEDHFSSLVLMRTKSSIEDLFERTAFME